MKAWKGMIFKFQNKELAFLGLVSVVIALPLSSNPGHLNIHQYFPVSLCPTLSIIRGH